MPTYCTAPNCKNDAKNKSDRKSYYKFPLHDPARLQQWLKNMGREGWTPSRHQHLCHEHFTPSCFTLRWGIRYLSNDAVPTVFQLAVNAEKRKSSDHSERKPKRRRPSGGSAPVQTAQACTLVAGETVCQDADANTVQLYTITLDHSHPGQPILLGSSDVEPSGRPGQTAVPLPVSFSPTVEGLGQAGGEEHAQVMLVSKNPLMEKEGEAEVEVEVEVEGITPAFLTEGQDIVIGDAVLQGEPAPSSLLIENMALEMVESSVAQDDRGVQVVAYFETIPSVLPTATAQPGLPPDTVLSSALSSKPIVSTLPIVSKHIPPSSGSLVLTLERLETVETEVEGAREAQEEDSVNQQGKQLEEHRYHKNSLSKEQLEAIVVELQKKVKVLQQRHRRHLDKLLGLESTVSQLRHSNLLNEERLHLLERAYIQTSAAVSDAGETVAIICGEENTAYLYALPASEGEEGTDQD